MNIVVKGILKGEYKGFKYEKIVFAYEADVEGFKGEFPFEVKCIRNNSVISTYKIPVCPELFCFFKIGDVINSNKLVISNYGKIIDYVQ